MFKRQETNLRRLLAMLLIPACLMCAGCDEVADESEQETDTTPASQSEKTVTGCADYDTRNSAIDYGIGECELTLHDGRHVTCAVMSGYKKGGLSCDWANAAKEASN